MSKRTVRLGIDLDGVCYDFVGSFRNYLMSVTDKTLEDYPDAESWNFYKDQWGLTLEQYIQHLVDGVNAGEVFWKGDVLPECWFYVTKLYLEGYDIVFITARHYDGLTVDAREATETWLDANGFMYDELIVTNDKTKVEYNLDILIDDSPGNLEKHKAAGLRAVAFDQRWNRVVEDAERCIGWKEVYEFVQENFPLKVADSSTV